MISFCFGEVGGFGLELFDAGVEAVEDVGFLVGTRHGEEEEEEESVEGWRLDEVLID